MRGVVGAALPFDGRQIRIIADPEVVERAEEIVLQGLPEAHLGCDAAVEELVLDVLAVHPSWRRRQTEEFERNEVVEDLAVGR